MSDLTKTKIEILQEIKRCKDLLKNVRYEYSRLHQIDMLSSTGSHLLKQTIELESRIKTLQWLL